MGIKRLFQRLLGFSSKHKSRTGNTGKAPTLQEPARHQLEAPTDPFIDLVMRYEERMLREWTDLPPLPASSPEIAFLITPWLWTAVPMFNIETALLTRRCGRAVRLIIDDENVTQNAEVASHRDAIRRLVGHASKLLPVTDASHQLEADGSSDLEPAKRICDSIAIWWERGETTATAFYERNPKAIQHVAAHLARVRQLLTKLNPAHIFITGGIFGLSAIYVRIAEELGLPYTTYDSNQSVVMLSRNSVACHRKDFPRLMGRLQSSLTEQHKGLVKRIVDRTFKKHQQGRDDLGIQMVDRAQDQVSLHDILVPLNIRWDAAALGCDLCFPSCMSWIENLLSWVEKHDRYSICLREHPAGRFPGAGSKNDLAPLLQRFSSLGARLRYIPADEPTNTYNLITGSKLVLPYTSTVGIEAAMLGKPVITHTSAYYADVGFSWPATDAAEYFRLVEMALDGLLPMSQSRLELASTAYYLSNCSWFLPGVFNPHPGPFKEWIEIKAARLLETTGAHEIVNALLHDEDVPLYLHKKNMAED